MFLWPDSIYDNPAQAGYPLHYGRLTVPTSFAFDICNQKKYDCTYYECV